MEECVYVNSEAITKILYGISEQQSLDITIEFKKQLSINGRLDSELDVNMIFSDPFPNRAKFILIYQNGALFTSINEFASKLLETIIDTKQLSLDKERVLQPLIKKTSCDNAYFIISHDFGGGLSKYVNDLIENKDVLIPYYMDYCIITNESSHKNTTKKNVYYSSNILQHIEKSSNVFNNIVIHFNSFPNYWLYDHYKIQQQFDIFYKLPNAKIIITVHDFFWLIPKDPVPIIHVVDNLILSDNVKNIVRCIFSMASVVIFPTFSHIFHYVNKGINLHNINCVISSHIDINYDGIIPYYPNINQNKINVIWLGTAYDCKGFNLLKHMININNNDSIYFHILGSTGDKVLKNTFFYGRYDYTTLFEVINKVKPNLFLLTSNYYESYSYVTSICLLLGIPIFYNESVYSERINNYRSGDNISCYDKNDNMDTVSEKFHKYINFLTKKGVEFKNVNAIRYKIPRFYKNIINNIDGIEKEIENYINKLDKITVNIENLVIITSKIIPGNVSWSYINTRSIYSPEERYEQTLETIKSVRKYIKNSFIIMIDDSDFDITNDKYHHLKQNVDILLTPRGNNLKYFTTYGKFKQIAELSYIKYLISYIKNNNFHFKNLFKITGRYCVNDTFSYDTFDNNENIFKKNIQVTDREYYFTCFYKISNDLFEKYVDSINKTFTNCLNDSNYAAKDLEVNLPFNIGVNNIKLVNNLGITQCIGVWKDNSNI